MYLDHFGLHESPFRITPHTDFFFTGANRGATLEALIYAITRDEGIVKVSGEVGSGKTMLCRVLIERLPEDTETIYLANPSLSRDEILYAIADELGVEVVGDRPTRLLRALFEHLIKVYSEGKRVVVLIDEAHAMPRETLEEIRLLSNLEANRNKLLQIVMFGQPELDDHLGTSEMRQLKERITHTFRLDPLVRGDIERYIDFRMRAAGYRGPNIFSAGAIRLIADASEGLTRRINILADKSLLAAFAANGHAVTVREVRRAIRDCDFYRPRLKLRPAILAGGSALVGLAAGLAIHFMLPDTPQVALAPTHTASTTAVAQVASASPGSSTPLPVQSVLADTPRPDREMEPPIAAGAAPKTAAATDRADQTESLAAINSKPERPPSRPTGNSDQAGAPDVPSSRAHGAPPPPRGALARERFAATQEWLLTAPPNLHAIQLVTALSADNGALEGFLLRASRLVPKEDLRVYGVKINGLQHYRVAYGSYGTIEEARAAMHSLPPALSQYTPYYRTVARMRSQNSQ